jgi:hypothetical protein
VQALVRTACGDCRRRDRQRHLHDALESALLAAQQQGVAVRRTRAACRRVLPHGATGCPRRGLTPVKARIA